MLDSVVDVGQVLSTESFATRHEVSREDFVEQAMVQRNGFSIRHEVRVLIRSVFLTTCSGPIHRVVEGSRVSSRAS